MENNNTEDVCQAGCETSDGAVKMEESDKNNSILENEVKTVILKAKTSVENVETMSTNVISETTNSKDRLVRNGHAPTEKVRREENITRQLRDNQKEEKIVEKANTEEIKEINNVNEMVVKADEVKSASASERDPGKREIVIIQKPKRSKSRRSLKKLPSINSVDLDINGHPAMSRTDRLVFLYYVAII